MCQRSGRSRSARTAENIATMRDSEAENPETFVKRYAQEHI